jgi:hypothetical protein
VCVAHRQQCGCSGCSDSSRPSKWSLCIAGTTRAHKHTKYLSQRAVVAVKHEALELDAVRLVVLLLLLVVVVVTVVCL